MDPTGEPSKLSALQESDFFFFQIDNPLTLLGTPYEGPSTKKSLELSWKLVAKDPL